MRWQLIGPVDAARYLPSGNTPSGALTRDLALFGVSVNQHDAVLALSGGLTLAGYGAGVLLAMPLAQTRVRGQPLSPGRVTVTLVAELALLAAFSGLWLASGAHRGAPAQLALLVIAAIAIGMQSTGVRRLGRVPRNRRSAPARKASTVATPMPVALRSCQPVADAARAMRDRGVGVVLVIQDGQLKGAVTERDIVVRVVAADRDAAVTPVGEICGPSGYPAGPSSPSRYPLGVRMSRRR
jgi:CBS domain-containing protein